MNKKPLLILLVLVLLGAAVVIATRQPADPAGGAQAYYFNLETADVFAAPKGGEGIKANVYSCGACEPSQWFVVTLEKDVTANGATVTKLAAPVDAGGEPVWLDGAGPQAQEIIQAALQRCGTDRPTYCTP